MPAQLKHKKSAASSGASSSSSASSVADEAASFTGDNHQSSTAQQEMEEIVRIVTNASAQENGGVLGKLQSLSKTLSHRQTGPAPPYDIDTEDFDFQRILKTFVKSADEQGIHLRSTGVIFKNVVTKGVDAAASFVPTVAEAFKGPFSAIKSKKAPPRSIIKNVSGFVKPGEMCLVLGRPGAGCSTLLKTIAGEHDQFLGVEGDINYDNIPQAEMMKKYKGDVIYNGELDVHLPHLTVDQTLRFSIGCKTPNTRVNNATREQYIEATRDLLATIFGLTHTYNTKVGNDFVRGVSGGERKRVSIAEAMSCKASVYCWDNATRGLDASTALEYAQAIRTQTNLTKAVAFITIYQAGENIYETFDKVLILYDGREIYFGPAEAAKQYFVDMGFDCPARQATAEFLTAVTDPLGRFPRAGWEHRVPKTADEFEAVWLNSKEYHSLKQEIDDYEQKADVSNTREKYDLSLTQAKRKAHYRYTVNYGTQLKLLTKRAFQKISGDRAFTITIVLASTVQALVAGSLYWNTPSDTSGAFSRGGLIYFMVLYFSLMGLAEIASQFAERPILLKQKSYSLFHPSAETLATTIAKFPYKLLSITIFYIIVYFLSNLTREAWRFFETYLFLIMTSECIGNLFQMIAALSQNVAGANAISGILMLATIVYSGFSIQSKSMHPWFKWIYYINPVKYGFENMVSTEFHGREMDCGSGLVPSGDGYTNLGSGEQVCSYAGSVTGETYVNGDNYLNVQFTYKFWHMWPNFGVLIGFWIVFVAVNAVATEFKRPVAGGGDHLYFKKSKHSKEMIQQNSDNGKNEDIESGSQTVQDSKESHENESSQEETNIFKGLGSTGIFMWQNVDYVIPYKGGSRKLLDNVQGYVKPGTLTALMGESGAGKTTLLNVLAQRIDMGTITGDFLVNGLPLDSSFRRSTGYVQQQDLHIDELTVRESLQFAARLRRPPKIPDAEKMEYVEKIIDILGMRSYSEAIVGSIGSGLNVEQRKKLSIGVELVAKPSLLLFLDEPTSGLDSQSAWAIVKLLQQLAAAGQSILCTIHQPSATLFESFDRLLLLKKGGKTVYFGDIGENSKTILDYFERNGARPCDAKENPAEYILEAIGAGATASVKEDWFEIWTASQEFQDVTNDIQELKVREYEHHTNAEEKAELAKTFALPYFSQLKYVVRRTGTQYYRDPQYIMSKFFLIIIGGLFIGFTFWDVGHSVIGMQNAMFSVFLPIIIGAPAINQIQERAVASRELFEVRESKSNTYHWSTLLLAQYINEVPYHIVLGALFFFCYYFQLKVLDTAVRAGVFYLNYGIMYQLYYISLGLFVVYFSPDLASANVITSLFLSFMISFCGVVQPLTLMPGFWTFMYKVSPMTYFVQTFIGLHLHDREITCKKDEYSYFNPPEGQTCYQFAESYVDVAGGYLKNPNATTNCGYCQYSVGDEYLSYINVKYSYRWRNFGFAFVYIIFNLAAMCVLYYIFRVANINPFSKVTELIEKYKQKKEKKKKDSN